MIRRPPRSTQSRSSAASDVYKRQTVVPGSGSKQSGCTRCAELMFRSTRYWLPLYPELVRSVQATRPRAHTRTRARVHTRPTLRIRISAARQITPTRGQKIEHAARLPHAQLGTLRTTQSAQLVPPTSMALNLEVSNKAPALLYRTHARPHGRICDHLKRVWRFGARSGFDEGHAVSASSMSLSRNKRDREEGERRLR